jgi:hypothetical protein
LKICLIGAKPEDVLEITTTCHEMHEKTPHPSQKPEELLQKLIRTTSNAGDTIVNVSVFQKEIKTLTRYSPIPY